MGTRLLTVAQARRERHVLQELYASWSRDGYPAGQPPLGMATSLVQYISQLHTTIEEQPAPMLLAAAWDNLIQVCRAACGTEGDAP